MPFLVEPRSPLLVIALAGRIGSGASFVREKLDQHLGTFGYDVKKVDVSTLILLATKRWKEAEPAPEGEQALADLDAEFRRAFPEAAKRTEELQNRGNDLRKQFGKDYLAALCVSDTIAPYLIEGDHLTKQTRVAFLIDSLKHPEEVALLREVFGDAFYLVGVVASDATRQTRLQKQKGYTPEEFDRLDERDADEPGLKHGQRTIKTVIDADYLFANDYAQKDEIGVEADRLLRLIFGVEVVSPRREEFGMHVAFKAALRSACLSRQVGAALFSKTGEVLATGHNDVPQFTGGLYSSDHDGNDDKRCWTFGGKCYNDDETRKLIRELVGALVSAELLKEEHAERATAAIAKTRIKSLIEFSRAVHGEMEAILAVARAGVPGIVGSTLYCTTYPCHTCAKHIIGAGVAEVVYLEPYEKSLALHLHDDAFSRNPTDKNKVVVRIYGGVAPKRYEQFFMMAERKDGHVGKFVDRDKSRRELHPKHMVQSSALKVRLENIMSAVESEVDRQGGGGDV